MDRENFYKEILQDLEALLDNCKCPISNCANASALLYTRLHEKFGEKSTNWVGFYFRCSSNQLQLGVCGSAAKNSRTELIKDVHKFPGHVACDAESQSELVVPIIFEGEVLGVLDMDSPVLGGFSETDKIYCEKMVGMLVKKTDFGKIRKFYNLTFQ